MPKLKFLNGGGQMGARIRDFDWAASPLGPPELWPLPLRSAVSICLNSSFPTAVYWGRQLHLLYNDAWAPIPAEKHPSALGRPAIEVWADIWPVVGPQFAQVMETGEGVSAFDQMLPMVRAGRVQETYWNYSFTPIRDDDGQVVGVLNQGNETTDRVANQRRQEFRLRLEEALRHKSDPRALMETAIAILGQHLKANRVGYGEVEPDDETVSLQVCWTDGVEPLAGSYRLDSFGKDDIARQRQGMSQFCEDVQDDPAQDETVWSAIDTRAYASVPLIRNGRFTASLYVNFREPHHWTEEEIAAIEDVGTRTWEAVELSRAEAGMRESEARFRNLADHAPVMMWVTDPQGCCTYLNRQWYEFTGQTEAEALGFGWLEATHPQDRAAAERVFLEANAERRPFRLDYRLRRHDGSYRWAIDAAAPRFSPNGDFLGYVGSVIDVDERREIEDRLRVSEERLRIATEAADIGTFDFDPISGTLQWDRRCKAAFGLAADAPVSYDVFLAGLHPADRAATDREVQRALAPDGPGHYKVEYRTIGLDDGIERWVAARGQALFDETQPGRPATRFVGSVLDITATKRAEDVLERRVEERTLELEAANRELRAQIEERERVQETLRQMQRLEAVGQLTSGVAHDFNNLLTVVLGSIRFIERAIARNEVDGRVGDRLGYMRMAAERGAALTAQLLAFSRRQRLEPKPVDLNETVTGMQDLLQNAMGGSVKLATALQPGLWPALADATQVELVLLNLAINARDAMEVGGSLTITTGNLTLGPPQRPGEPAAGDYVMVAVSDTGTGMTPEVLAKAFEPFFTTKEAGKGSGLGLAQVYGFAKQSGGGVVIETKLGEGTTIRVFLPKAAQRAGDATAAIAAPQAQLGRVARVLLVDDDSRVREVTRSLLAELGCEITEFGSGAAVVAALEQASMEFDLAVFDFAMPGMNGRDLARQVQARYPSLPVIFVTGYADLAALHDVSDERIVQKPYRDGELERKVQQALQVSGIRPGG
ncbi:hypothetical protein ASG72_02515 [Bosea sp. Leaf344]|uniref:PAS domain S-box protein n=1 Tax=Bosea sp. Leaf344 TaxID=1736346 RepID=UPI000712F4F1|nr:PAS domain S-box protein [Bosea sp. Leaf344]KQU54529.1 hypothetical protein ASG72_02515 [Bosea sp. Leaf344]